MTQLAEMRKKIRVASDPGLDPGEEAPKGGVGLRRALPAGRGPKGQDSHHRAWPVVREIGNGPSPFKTQVGLPPQSNVAETAAAESTAKSGLKGGILA